MMEDKFELITIAIKDEILAVRVYGNGKKKAIAFHGYGQDGSVFEKWVNFHTEYSLYSVDLFYHGHSSWPEEQPGLSHDQFLQIFRQIINKFEIESFLLLGFSMGGKFVLSLMQTIPGKIEEVVLIAPDGIYKDFWYRLGARSEIGKVFFKYFINHPALLFNTVKFLSNAKIVDRYFSRFTIQQMSTLEQRTKVYKSWLYLNKFFVPTNQIAKSVEKYSIPMTIVLGKHDRIISRSRVEKFAKKIKRSNVKIIESGHSKLVEAFIKDNEN